MSEAEKQAIIDGGNLRYLWIGLTHMLSGLDHLLFVLGVILLSKKFNDIVKTITAFTIGHSISLIVATFNAWQFNYYLVDAIIALSIVVIAIFNLYDNSKQIRSNHLILYSTITGFGLIHGLGLSTRLQQLPLSNDDLLSNILSFNVGIELGQIFAILPMILLLRIYKNRHYYPILFKSINRSLIFLGGVLFFVQLSYFSELMIEDDTPPDMDIITKDSKKKANITWQDFISIEVPANGANEFKLHLAQGATFEYAWKTSGKRLDFDFHGDPKGAKKGVFVSFLKRKKSRSSGIFTAKFDGNHGWFWENHTTSPVIIILKVKGDYSRIDIKK